MTVCTDELRCSAANVRGVHAPEDPETVPDSKPLGSVPFPNWDSPTPAVHVNCSAKSPRKRYIDRNGVCTSTVVPMNTQAILTLVNDCLLSRAEDHGRPRLFVIEAAAFPTISSRPSKIPICHATVVARVPSTRSRCLSLEVSPRQWSHCVP